MTDGPHREIKVDKSSKKLESHLRDANNVKNSTYDL